MLIFCLWEWSVLVIIAVGADFVVLSCPVLSCFIKSACGLLISYTIIKQGQQQQFNFHMCNTLFPTSTTKCSFKPIQSCWGPANVCQCLGPKIMQLLWSEKRRASPRARLSAVQPLVLDKLRRSFVFVAEGLRICSQREKDVRYLPCRSAPWGLRTRQNSRRGRKSRQSWPYYACSLWKYFRLLCVE